MIKWTKLKLKLKKDSCNKEEYEKCIDDLIQDKVVLSMKNFIQHSNINCLEHSLYVSYSSYLICKRLGLDYRCAARGGLLHDLFLYDWHIKRKHKRWHGFRHPYIALQNANKYFQLNDLEKDIIKKHMWPLTIILPRYKEAYVVAFVDKYCASREILKFRRKNVMQGLLP
jgi:uncharacterized protein